MEKIKFGKEETKNLLNMLKSSDAENHIIAFEALQNADLTDYHGELLVLYKYSKLPEIEWKNNCSKAFEIITDLLGVTAEPLSSPKLLSIMTCNKATKDSIELFLEVFMLDLTHILHQIGYPTEKISIDIKLKD